MLSKNFSTAEIKCKCGCNTIVIDESTDVLLQKLRDKLGKSIIVSSGYRCPAKNKACGGAKRSQHMLGKARDIKVSGLTPLEVAYAAIEIGFKGVGVYTHNDNYFTHVDTRKTKTYWIDQKDTHDIIIVKKL